jgi:hypothetical protein
MKKIKRENPVARKLTAIEREFTATIADDEDSWHVATASYKYVNKLKKLGWIPTKVDAGGYSFFEVPRRCIGFRSLTPKKLSKEAREAISKRLSKVNTVDTTAKNEVNNGKV